MWLYMYNCICYSILLIFIILSWFVDPVTRSTLTDAIRATNPCTENSETSCKETPMLMIPLAGFLGPQGPLHQNPPHYQHQNR